MSTTPLPAHGWVTPAQLAEHLGVARRTIERWVAEEGLPSVKIGGKPGAGGTRRFYMPEVFEWLREHRDVAGSRE